MPAQGERLLGIDRNLLRTFRLLVRRAMKLTPRSPKPRIVLLPTADGVMLQAEKTKTKGSPETTVTVVRRLLRNESISQAVSVPFQLLVECEGRRGEVELRFDGEQLEALWQDGGVPRRLTLPATVPETSDDGSGVALAPMDPRLLTALAEASSVADPESLRYALGCVHLSRELGRVTGTDGKQLLSFSGFEFPWEKDVLVPASSIYEARELRQGGEVAMGTTKDRVVLRCGVWSLELQTDPAARFPRVEGVIPDAAGAVCRVQLSALDREFLAENLSRLPGADRDFSPVTVDVNGHVALLAADGQSEQVTEVTLSDSTSRGEDIRFASDRNFLNRAVRLGLEELCVFSPEKPVLCQSDRCTYVWMPLTNALTEPAEPMIRIASSAGRKTGGTKRREVRVEAPVAPVPTENPVTPEATAPEAAPVTRQELEQFAAMASELAERLQSQAAAMAL